MGATEIILDMFANNAYAPCDKCKRHIYCDEEEKAMWCHNAIMGVLKGESWEPLEPEE